MRFTWLVWLLALLGCAANVEDNDMGRPHLGTNPPATFTWATETNYPAGILPWSGRPIKVPPAGDYWVPNQKPPAENDNSVLNAVGTSDAAVVTYAVAQANLLADWTAQDPVLNWHNPQTPAVVWPMISGTGSGQAWGGAVLAPAVGNTLTGPKWLVLLQSSIFGVGIVSTTGSDPNDWAAVTNQFFGSTVGARGQSAIMYDPTDSNILYVGLCLGGGLGFSVQKLVISGPTVTTVLSATGWTADQITAAVTSTGAVVFGVTDVTGTQSKIYATSNHGASWSSTAFGGATKRMCFAQSLNALNVAITTSGITGSSYSTDGVTWTSGLVAWGTDTVEGLAVASNQAPGDLYAATTDGATYSKIWHSAHGSNTWSQISSRLTASLYDDLAGMGNILITCAHNGSDRIAISVDESAGWHYTPAALATGTGRPLLYVNDLTNQFTSQLCAVRDGELRFSQSSGLPVQGF